MLLYYRELGGDPACLPNIDVLRQSIAGPNHVRAKTQSGISVTTFHPGRLSLHPIQHRERQLASAAEVSLSFLFADAQQRTKPVIDLRPVDEGDVTVELTGRVMPAIEDAPKVPEVVRMRAIRRPVEDRPVPLVQGLRMPVGPSQLPSRPEVSGVRLPECIMLGAFDGVILAGAVIDRVAP